MKVTIYKLDNPQIKSEWWKKVFEIKVKEDLEKINGLCGIHIYAGRTALADDDTPGLDLLVDQVFQNLNTSPFEIIDLYYLLMIKVVHEGTG